MDRLLVYHVANTEKQTAISNHIYTFELSVCLLLMEETREPGGEPKQAQKGSLVDLFAVR